MCRVKGVDGRVKPGHDVESVVRHDQSGLVLEGLEFPALDTTRHGRTPAKMAECASLFRPTLATPDTGQRPP
jgi:hypothetical protein